MDFVGGDGDAGIGLGFLFGHDHTKQSSLFVQNSPTAVAMMQIKIQFKEFAIRRGQSPEAQGGCPLFMKDISNMPGNDGQVIVFRSPDGDNRFPGFDEPWIRPLDSLQRVGGVDF